MEALHSYKLNKYALISEKCSPKFTWKIEGITEISKRKRGFSVESEQTFICNSYPQVEARAKLSVDGDHLVAIGLALTRRRDEGFEAEIRSVPTVHYVLMDRSENGAKHIVCSRPTPFGQPFNYDMNFALDLCYQDELRCLPFYVDDLVVVEIYVEPPAMPVHSFNGILNWTIEDYQKVRAAMKECPGMELDSPYFYTRFEGYRAQAKYRFSEENPECSAVVIRFLSGENDAHLSPSFPHLTTVELINPDFPSHGVQKTEYQSEVDDPGSPHELTMETDCQCINNAERLLIQVAIKPDAEL